MKCVLFALLCATCALSAKLGRQEGDWITGPSGQKRYAFLKHHKNWEDARDTCRELGGHLAVPTSQEENDFLQTAGRHHNGMAWWIGLYAGQDRRFWTVNEYEVTNKYNNWASGEPNNFMSWLGSEDCVEHNTAQNGWNDQRCSNLLWFICEKGQKALYNFMYFDVAARGEVARLLFALADVDYADTRVKNEQWPAMKYTTLWGVLPQLNITEDGETTLYCQSNTIHTVLAHRFGLMGDSKEDMFYIEMLVDCMTDVMAPLFTLMQNSPGTPQYDVTYNSTRDKLPWWYGQAQKFLERNDNGNGWFVGDKPTLADVMTYHTMWMIEVYYPGTANNFPKLHALYQRFESLPNIAEWLGKRPDSPI